jgi:hypothetical protein
MESNIRIFEYSNINTFKYSISEYENQVEYLIEYLIIWIDYLDTVVGVVVSVLGTLINTSSAGTGSNPTIGIQSSIVAVNF